MRHAILFFSAPFFSAVLFSSALFFSASTHAADIKPFTASYHFDADEKLSGSATRTLEKLSNNEWRYVFAATVPIGSSTEISRFRFDGKTVTPLLYEQKRKIFFKKKNASINFDWKSARAIGHREGSNVDYPLKAGTLDALNMEIQIRSNLKTNGKLGGPFIFASPKDASPLNFIINGEEIISTPYGRLKTLKVSRIHADPKRHTTFWLAKDLDFLPAKVMQNDDGAVFMIELESYKPAK